MWTYIAVTPVCLSVGPFTFLVGAIEISVKCEMDKNRMNDWGVIALD